MDKVDKKILTLLQKNSQISNLELSEQVALSPSPCLRRVKQLEEQGVVARQVALCDPDKLGLPLLVLVSVGLRSHSADIMKNFERAIRDIPEVVQCYLITGQSADYQLKVVMPDLHYFQQFLLEQLTGIEGVANVQSSFVLNRVVDKTELPLTHA